MVYFVASALIGRWWVVWKEWGGQVMHICLLEEGVNGIVVCGRVGIHHHYDFMIVVQEG
jgi:hypothetical protein